MYTFFDLKNIMETLRSAEGCPWDRAQTHETLKKHLVQESAEVLEAIDEDDPDHLCEELGDLLFQVMSHSEIEKEKGNFTVDDVVDGICVKMIRRHPHVFGTDEERAKAPGPESWEEIKAQEKAASKVRQNGVK